MLDKSIAFLICFSVHVYIGVYTIVFVPYCSILPFVLFSESCLHVQVVDRPIQFD